MNSTPSSTTVLGPFRFPMEAISVMRKHLSKAFDECTLPNKQVNASEITAIVSAGENQSDPQPVALLAIFRMPPLMNFYVSVTTINQ